MTFAIDFVRPKGRFARSVNVERDAGGSTIDSYLPTGRALDVVNRVTRCIAEPHATRAFSITGPYGTGKSSLAVFLDALLGPVEDDATVSAFSVLVAADPVAAEMLQTAKGKFGDGGFVRASITATREPVASTIVRALASGVSRYPAPKRNSQWRAIRGRLDAAAAELADRDRPHPTNRLVLELIDAVSVLAPVALVIDEFGKNLEAFADSRSEADLYLLQELVEWAYSADEDRNPVVTVTMQHLSFEEYLDTVSQSLRREWAKVQGRFEDIPYIDTPDQTRYLIAQVHEQPVDSGFLRRRRSWARSANDHVRKAGLAHELDAELVERAWPLHPSALLVLPDLCARYGQNERTLFSFLASAEPLAVPTWLVGQRVGTQLHDVRLDHVYDYFVESAATTAATSQTASRWVEVETAIRDATGLSDGQRRVLKAIGLLNLVSAGGSVRASRRILAWVCVDGRSGTATSRDVEDALDELERTGRITYREFADEYRLWRGSDLDLRAAVESARRRLRQRPAEELLASTRSMLPLVAAKHSTLTGTLRVFTRIWDSDGVLDASATGAADGLLVYVVGSDLPRFAEPPVDERKPVIAVRPANTDELLRTALELAAVRSVLDDSSVVGDDLVARRELAEREAEALARFDSAFQEAVGHRASATEWWRLDGPSQTKLRRPISVTAALSEVCDQTYQESPRVASEMLNRHELTSQGAKARRLLIEGLLLNSQQERLGIEGFPPERAMYDAVLGSTGIHRLVGERFVVAQPTADDWLPAWRELEQMLDRAQSHRIGVDQILSRLGEPPIGLKAGVAPVLFVAGIIAKRSEVALYEHGTYRPRLTPDIAERLVRNPAHFQVKHYAATRGARREVVAALAGGLGVKSWRDASPTVLSVVGHLVSLVNGLSGYAKQTSNLSEAAMRVRRALLDATEPDVLLFESLPAALELPSVAASARRKLAGPDPDSYATAMVAAVDELRSAHALLLDKVIKELVSATKARSGDPRAELASRAEQVRDGVLDPRLSGLLSALADSAKDDEGWAEYVGMTVVGPAVTTWSDDDRLRYIRTVKELGETLRQIEAIYFERRAHSDSPFDAIRVSVTRPDGVERSRVIGLDDAVRDAVGVRLASLIDAVAQETGDEEAAIELVLAVVAERMLPVVPDQVSQVRRKVGDGQPETKKARGS